MRIHGEREVVKPRHVYIYTGKGTSPASIAGWIHALECKLNYPKELIHTTGTSHLIANLTSHLAHETSVIIPGGADLHYVRDLYEDVTLQLRAVIAAGASYIGTCAGAYFASGTCTFEAGSPGKQVMGSRKLCLFPFSAVGAVRPDFEYDSEVGATIEQLTANWKGSQFAAAAYCNGGCAWAGVRDCADVHVVARYDEAVLSRHGIAERTPVAVLAHRFGHGVAVLSGVHPEMDMRNMRFHKPTDGCLSNTDHSNDMLLTAIADAALLR